MTPLEPKIICIMPCYNAEKTIAKAIESVASQNYSNWELIIVDDASTDKSVKVIKKYLNNPKITLLQNKTNRGCYYSRNRAVHHVKDQKWDWFTVHDSDDTSHPDRFSIFMAFAYHGDYHYLLSAGRGSRYDWKEKKVIHMQHDGAPGQSFISYTLFNELLGYFNPELRHSADSEYMFKYEQIVNANLQLENIKNPALYCKENKVYVGRIGKEFSYTYTWGFTLGNNLTQKVSKKDKEQSQNQWVDKWGKPGIPLKDFYQDFTPHKEDL